MEYNLEIERIGNTITCMSGVIHMVLDACHTDDERNVSDTIDRVCYITEYIEIQASKLLAVSREIGE